MILAPWLLSGSHPSLLPPWPSAAFLSLISPMLILCQHFTLLTSPEFACREPIREHCWAEPCLGVPLRNTPTLLLLLGPLGLHTCSLWKLYRLYTTRPWTFKNILTFIFYISHNLPKSIINIIAYGLWHKKSQVFETQKPFLSTCFLCQDFEKALWNSRLRTDAFVLFVWL